MINILDYEMLGFEEYVSDTAIVLNKHREYEVLKGIKWYFIELPKFRRKNPDMNDSLNQWLAFIDDYDKGLVKVAEEKNKTLKKAREEMNYLTGDAEMQRLAELREKWEMDYNSAKASGFSDGREEGRKEGIEVGRKQRELEIAKKLLKKNTSIEEIIEITGLTKEEINQII